MLLSHIKRLCILSPSLIAAIPHKTDSLPSVPSSLPYELARTVPPCAQPCVQSLVSERFPLSCTAQNDISCLCSQYSLSGDSLGEVALGCIYAACPTVDRTAVSAYNICQGQKSAVPPTHTVLTVVASTPFPSTSMAASRPVTMTQATTTIASPSRAASTSIGTVLADSVSVTPSSTSSTSLPAAASSNDGNSPRKMQTAQIVGLTVAGVAVIMIAAGLVVLGRVMRKRRAQKKASHLFEQKPHDSSPSTEHTRNSYELAYGITPRKLQKQSPKAPSPANRTSRRFRSETRHSMQQSKPKGSPSSISTGPSPASDQIGVAISAGLPGTFAAANRSVQPPQNHNLKPLPIPKIRVAHEDTGPRPESTLTQDTVFEEDDPPTRNRPSMLLPTPPILVPPIRSFRPPRPPPKINTGARPPYLNNIGQNVPQQPELFLDIPIRHERPQPKPIITPNMPSRNSSQKSREQRQHQLSPPVELSKYPSLKSTSTARSTPDIPDYYFTAHQGLAPGFVTPKASSERLARQKESSKTFQVKQKVSSSTVSRTASRTSTNARDSISSQTSFETVDENDPTPEDEDDKQLYGAPLSPVVESPISYLRYPKVPRASNQLVPRSPKSPQSQRSQGSPDWPPDPVALLARRREEREALKYENRFHTGSPSIGTTSPNMRAYRQHSRSKSVETWESPRWSNRTTRTQSGQWPRTPAMYEEDVVQPLNIRNKEMQQRTPVDANTLKSPVWVPRLTPRREGDDLLISVTYSTHSQSMQR